MYTSSALVRGVSHSSEGGIGGIDAELTMHTDEDHAKVNSGRNEHTHVRAGHRHDAHHILRVRPF